MRSRICKLNNYIIITNMKVMYSSINMIDNIIPLSENIQINNNDIIFLYRNTLDRIISCFLNWCFRNKNRIGIMETLSKIDNFNYKLFCDLIDKQNLIESFKMFIESIKYIINDNHLKPQSFILNYLNIKNIKYFINIDDNDDLTLFENTIKYKLPKVNCSICENKILLKHFLLNTKNKYYYNIIQNLYKDDTEYFLKYNIIL